MLANQSHLSHFNLKISGSQAPKKVMDEMLDCTVENSIHLPDMCSLRIHDAEFEWLDANTFREGTKIEVFGGEENAGALRPLFNGEVTALELDLAAHGVPTLVVRCLDRSHRLHRGRYSRSFVQMTDSDIVQKIAGEAGFTVHADSTAQVHDWVLQNNQTNWEFLIERAARNGFRLYVKHEKDLHFQKVKEQGDDVIELDWGNDLRSFRPRVAAGHQVDEVIVRGWDPQQKQPIIGRCTRPSGVPQVRESQPGGEVAKQAFGAARMVVVDRPIHAQREADDLARSICDDIGGEFLEADGLCYGQPNLKPGVEVQINNIGKRFSGKYYVTSTTHTYTPAEGYTTLFAVNGKRPSALMALLEPHGSGKRAPLGGNIVIGIVTDNRDPDGMGRVKVKYPWLTEEHTSFWARTTSQMAGKGRGMFNLPEIEDEVLVAFEHGDIRRPYVLGQLWNGKDALPTVSGNSVLGPSSEVNRRGFHTRIGHQLNFDDTGGQGDITLKTAGGHVVTLDDAGKKIKLSTTGGHTITMDDAGNSIIIRDNAGDTIVMQQGIVTMSAMIMMNLAAPVINIVGAVATNVAGLMTNIKAGTLLNMSGQVGVNVSSQKVAVHGSAAVEVNGTVIKLN